MENILNNHLIDDEDDELDDNSSSLKHVVDIISVLILFLLFIKLKLIMNYRSNERSCILKYDL